MEDLSLHILDIVENSLRAGAKNVEIKLCEDKEKDLLTLKIKDDGKGMDKETINKCYNPFFTTKEDKKIGLGIPLLYQSAKEAGGNLKIVSKEGKGTKMTATFKLSNIDIKPRGNIEETMKVLKAAHKDIKFIYEEV